MQEAIVQALPVQSKSKKGKTSSLTPPSSHRTRSQAAPDWTTHEVLVLLNEISTIDEDWLEELSSYQRWKLVSDSCMAMNVVRSSNQCKRKWEMLLGDYRKIRLWESRSTDNSYWFILEDRRKDFGLPASFSKEVFDAMDAVIQVQEHQSDSNTSDSDFETSYMGADSELITPSKRLQMEENTTISKSPDMEEPMTTTKSQELEGLIATSRSPEVDESKSPEMACAMAGENLITTAKRPEAKELITTSKSPDVEESNTISKRPEKGYAVAELITNSNGPEAVEPIPSKSRKAGDLFTTNYPEVEVLFTASKISQKDSALAAFPTVSTEVELITTSKSSEKVHAMAEKLQGCAEHVCAMLRGELQDGASHCPSALHNSPKPSAAQMELARRQADELIKALAGLTNSLDELCELAGNGGG